MESKTVEQQYKEVKVLRIQDYGKTVKENPPVNEFSVVERLLETYLKDGWSIISYTTESNNALYHIVVLGR